MRENVTMIDSLSLLLEYWNGSYVLGMHLRDNDSEREWYCVTSDTVRGAADGIVSSLIQHSGQSGLGARPKSSVYRV